MTNTPQQPASPLPVQMTISSQYVKDFSFENPNAPNSLLLQGQPRVNVNVQVQARPIAEQTYESVLIIRAEGRIAETQAFIVELVYGAVCAMPASVQQDSVRPLLLIEAPRFMFPFARAIISEAVRNGGYGPLLLSPVDFTEMYRRQALSEQTDAQDQQGIAHMMTKTAAGTA